MLSASPLLLLPQKVNHFYGMLELCRKKQLARNLAAMAAEAPHEYTDLAPRAFQLPEQRAALAAELAHNCATLAPECQPITPRSESTEHFSRRGTGSATQTPRGTDVGAARTPWRRAASAAAATATSQQLCGGPGGNGSSAAAEAAAQRQAKRTYIFKPSGGSQGRGIRLLQSEVQMRSAVAAPMSIFLHRCRCFMQPCA